MQMGKVLSAALREGVVRHAFPREIGSMLSEYRPDLSGREKIEMAKKLAQEGRVLAWSDRFDTGRGRYGTAQIRMVAAEMAAWNENVLSQA